MKPVYRSKRNGVTPLDRLIARLTAFDAFGCWEWTGGRYYNGYAAHTVNGRAVRGHRYMYEQVYGPIPPGMVVMHECDNPPCCNPLHLRLGTTRDNVLDKFSKGRANISRGESHVWRKHPELVRRGSQCAHATLTEDLVRQMRLERKNGETSAAIARKHGVSYGAAKRAINGSRWQHVTSVSE